MIKGKLLPSNYRQLWVVQYGEIAGDLSRASYQFSQLCSHTLLRVVWENVSPNS